MALLKAVWASGGAAHLCRADDPKRFDFTQAIERLEEINTWFQNEDFNLDEGLQKLKQGKELIKKCRTRLHEVENEFVKVKQEFAEEAQESESLKPASNDSEPTSSTDGAIDPDHIPF